ncbi:hypothetical protein QS468_56900, partial [Bacillus subtilis]
NCDVLKGRLGTAQKVAQLSVIKPRSKPRQALPIKASSQVRKKLHSTAQLLAHFFAVSYSKGWKILTRDS